MTLLTPLTTYQLVGSMKLHFNNLSYDIRKYKLNRNRFTEESFEKTRGRIFYHKLCKDYQFMDRLMYLCASNYFYYPKATVNELYDNGRTQYLEFRKRSDSQLFYFDDDLSKLMIKNRDMTSLRDILIYRPERVYDSIISGEFHPYSAAILDRLDPFIDNIRKESSNLYMEMIYGPVHLRLNKFAAFVSIENDGALDALKDIVKKYS